jgi:hypothetical protein
VSKARPLAWVCDCGYEDAACPAGRIPHFAPVDGDLALCNGCALPTIMDGGRWRRVNLFDWFDLTLFEQVVVVDKMRVQKRRIERRNARTRHA